MLASMCAGTENASDILGVEEGLGWNHALDGEVVTVRVRRVAAQGAPELRQLGRKRLELRLREVLLIVRHRRLVAPALVARHRLSRIDVSGECTVHGLREQLGITERIADAERQERVLVASGISDQGPAAAVRLAQKIRDVGHAIEALLPAARTYFSRKVRHLVEKRHETTRDVRSDRRQLRGRPRREYRKQVIVRGKCEQDL